MDPSSSSNPNWLAFSLSNHSLFQPSSTTGGAADQEHTNHHLPVLGADRPKLEDFLGGAGTPPDAAAAQFDGGAQGTMYHEDSDLKTIAAGILGGFDSQKQLAVEVEPPPPPPKKSAVESFGHRTSIFRGVTRHRWTGRYEAHLWDNSCRREGQSRKGRQVYLGGYDKEEKAARAYDLAALKYWGPTTTTNFPVTDYHRELEEMKNMTRQEFVASLRRRSSGFSRGASMYRGVTRHHQHGRWQARIGRVAGNKDLYLGTFSTQEEAAEAYDIAAIKFRGLNAVTNFDMNRYDVVSIASSNVPVGSATNKSKTLDDHRSQQQSNNLDDNVKLLESPFPIFPLQNSSPMLDYDSMQPKQDNQSISMSLWAALGYQNPSSSVTNDHSHDSDAGGAIVPYGMGFPDSGDNHDNANDGFFNGYVGYYHDQSAGDGTTTTTTTLGTDEDATRDALVYGGNGNWMVAPPPTAKPVFQTPIFGVE